MQRITYKEQAKALSRRGQALWEECTNIVRRAGYDIDMLYGWYISENPGHLC